MNDATFRHDARVPSPPHPERPSLTADVSANRRAMVEYRWRRAHADYLIGCQAGALSPGEDWRRIIAQIYTAYVIADAQE